MPLYRQQDTSGLVLPVETRTAAIDTDFVFMIDATTNIPYRITKADLLTGLSSGGSSSGGGTASNTLLLLHGDGSSIFDSSSHNRTPVSSSGVSLSTVQSKFSGSSLLFSNGALVYTSTDFNIGSGDATVQFFFFCGNTTTGQNVIDFRPNSTNGNYPVIYLLNGALSFQFGSNTAGTLSPALNSWNYGVLQKIGSTTTLWLNGSSSGSIATGDWASSGQITIGTGVFGAPYAGYIDEFKFSNVSSGIDPSIIPSLAFAN